MVPHASTWKQHGCHVDIMWFPCAHHVVSRWTPFGFQVDTMWFPGGQHRVSKVDTMWFLQDTTGFPHGCHVVSIWTPCVVEVTTWKPAQLCMKPTGFLVNIINNNIFIHSQFFIHQAQLMCLTLCLSGEKYLINSCNKFPNPESRNTLSPPGLSINDVGHPVSFRV